MRGNVPEILDAQLEATETPPAATATEPRVRRAIAVLMQRFPHIADTFILREINELERQGQPVIVVPAYENRAGVMHEEARPWIGRALFTPLFSPSIAASNLKMVFSRPGRYFRLLGQLIAGTIIRPSTMIRTLALFPKSVHLAVVLPERGVRHLHAHFATHATTMAYIVSSLTDLTYSFTVHGPDVFVHRLLLREKIAKASGVRAVSTFNKAFLSGLYPEECEGKIEVIRTGVNPDVYEEAAEESRRRSDRPLVVSVAELTPSRGFVHLVEACARLIKAGVNMECRIAGDGPLRRETEMHVRDSGVGDSVRLLGALPQHEVAALLGDSDIFVLPGIVATDGQMDGIPMSLMEAMAAGKPVVASPISGIPELVANGVNGLLVDAGNPERVAQALTRLIRDPELRETLGRAGRQTVRRSFDVRRNVGALLDFLDRHEQERPTTPALTRVAALNWSRLHAHAIGVRRGYDRTNCHVTDVTISDGAQKREVIVRQPRIDALDGTSPLDRARNEFEVLSTLAESLQISRGPDGWSYSVPELLMFDEPNVALVLRRADGQSLAGIYSSDQEGWQLVEATRHAGQWLRAMQTCTRQEEDGRHVLTAVILLALRHLDLAAAADHKIARMRGAIADRLRELETLRATQRFAVVGHHGDFRPDNIYIGEKRVTVTSFGCFREGLPVEDVAQFLVDLEVRFAARQAVHSPLREAFLQGYGLTGDVDPAALKLYTLCKALRMLANGGHESAASHTALRNILKRSLA